MTQLLRKISVLALGSTLLLVGIALLVLPGPAFIVIPCGLAVLAIEFHWARRALAQARRFLSRAARARRLASSAR